jgi:hypothetical protein
MVIIQCAQRTPKGRDGDYVKYDDGTVYKSGTVEGHGMVPTVIYSGGGQLKEADRIIDDGVLLREAYGVAATE